MKKVILIAYSEIGLKSPPVRHRLENLLMRHIIKKLEFKGIKIDNVRRIQGRLIIDGTDCFKVAEAITKVFGVVYTMPAIRITNDLSDITNTVIEVAEKILKPKQTFAINARRVGDQPYSSKEIEVLTGKEVLNKLSGKGVRVDLTNPDKTIHVEVRGKNSYVYSQMFCGFAGLPFASQGKIVSLFSGGIDSPVASWFMMRRGCHVSLLFYDQRPFVGDDYYERALKVARKIREYVPMDHYYLNIISLGKIMNKIISVIPSKLVCLCCKRMMYRIACILSKKIGAKGLVTGETLGQVASQTLFNLRVLDETSSLPIYRPLIGFEKLETVRWAKKIGTYQVSTTRVHECKIVPKKPATKAKILDVKKAEEKLDIQTLSLEALRSMIKIPL